ncbi:MAG: methyltransferase [Desulfurococcaceae archaeon]
MHYYKKTPGKKILIPFTLHGISLQFISYTSLFSGSMVDEGTRILLENIKLPGEGIVLDMGCGYGVIGITIAKLNQKLRVYMVDINPLAVKASRYNAKSNNVEDRVIVLQGDRYTPVSGILFDAIYSNPPLSAGMEVVEEIVLGALNHLKKNGFAQFILAKGGEQLAREAKKIYSYVEAVGKKGYILLYLKP